MKKIVLSLLCAMLAFTLTADEEKPMELADIDKKIAELQLERQQVQTSLIRLRRDAIRSDKYAAKLAREILTLNQQLSEYLNTKPDIKRLNLNLTKIDRQLKELYELRAEQQKKAEEKKAAEAKAKEQKTN